MANNIGAEVGQKMRSAIKAKLLELNCYVDDELPDYIMVMVANKRTKSQMKEDLQLFLNTKTTLFVDWLHIVLKKLKEVTVTNPEVYKKSIKRKSEEQPLVNVKKEKRKPKEPDSTRRVLSDDFKSLTDDLPINANKLAEQRKIVIMRENQSNVVDNFDIPLLSEVNMSTEEELEDIERKIKTVKSRLGLLVESDSEDHDFIILKPEPDELLTDKKKPEPPPPVSESLPKKLERTVITFDKNDDIQSKRKSIHDRLGKRRLQDDSQSNIKKSRVDKEIRRNEKKKEGVLSRLGVMSRVAIPTKDKEEPEEPFKGREVPSVVKVRPRVIPPDAKQANKNLLLKAVADAQRSIAQTPHVGSNKPDALYTKKYKEKLKEKGTKSKRLPEVEKNKIKKILTPSDDVEYVPAPLKKIQQIPKYIPTTKSEDEQENVAIKQQFIVTLDGIEKTTKLSIKSRLDKKKSPSPIIFDRTASPVQTKSNIPDKLPIVHAPPSIKNKERCKYWPNCRQGDKCEFVHPSANCEMFPRCIFGDKCLYLHPTCKFGSSCTRRDCPYNHLQSVSLTTGKGAQQICKFFPNCTNLNCSFYHPKPCKFGKFCKNQSECTFTHGVVPGKTNLTWRSK